jgi:hypothetical protein
MLQSWKDTDLISGVLYGTVLGATAFALFPDRIDRAVLDGVQNPLEYYHTLFVVFLSSNPASEN